MNAEVFFDEIKQDVNQDIKNKLEILRDDMIMATPVDTGNLRSSYSQVIQLDEDSFEISNNAEYADFILSPEYHHSKQLPEGLEPIIQQWLLKLKR